MEKKINDTIIMIIDCLFGSVGISCPPAHRSVCGASGGLIMIKPFSYDREPQSQELPTSQSQIKANKTLSIFASPHYQEEETGTNLLRSQKTSHPAVSPK